MMQHDAWKDDESPSPEELEAFADETARDLESLRWQGWREGAPALPPRQEDASPVRAARAWWPRGLAVAAALLLVVWLGQSFGGERESGTYRLVRAEQRVATEDSRRESHHDLGEVLETGAQEFAYLTIPEMGELRLGASTRVRLLPPGQDPDAQHLVRLEQGQLLASILADPRRFQIDTPAGRVVDLGCVFEVSVDAAGALRVAVTSGAVAIESAHGAVHIPAGAFATAVPGARPDIPVREAADPELAASLVALGRASSLRVGNADFDLILERAEVADAVSLWHLLARAEGPERFVYAKLLERLVPMPAGYDPDECIEPGTAGHEAWRQAQPWARD